jgi:hypothetical protein
VCQAEIDIANEPAKYRSILYDQFTEHSWSMGESDPKRLGVLNLKAGEWVEVRGREEILATLDENGCLETMPFMPEMFAFCGQRFRVYKRAHKTCDTVFPVRGRRVSAAVHLETRCDGQAHGGCQAGCLLFWKEAWLKRVNPDSPERTVSSLEAPSGKNPLAAIARCTESDVWAHAKAPDADGGEPIYKCQATQLPYATTNLAWWDLRQYIEDYRSGNVGLWRLLCGFIYSMYYHLSQAGIGLGPAMRWFYDKFHPLWCGTLFPRKVGTIPEGQPTPTATLNLQPGELVRVKSHEEILQTLTTNSMNRGMTWDAELVPYCGRTYRVLSRVTKIIHEKTGKMQEMKNPCIILESVVCQARYSNCRMFCPRSIFPYWREIWLERIQSSTSDSGETK